MNIDYYQQQDFRFVEVATAIDRFYYTSKGKFFINSITPLLSSGSALNDSKGKSSTTNILNYSSKLNISSCTVSNYVDLLVPEYIAREMRDINGYISKGTKFLIVFVGGDINKPRIMGVY